MARAHGDTLDDAVRKRLGDREALRHLAPNWQAAVAELRHAGLTHGDLQNSNVLVDEQLQIRLVDQDSARLPEGQPWRACEARAP